MDQLRLDILMITWNRPRYTRLALEGLLDSCGPGMRVWVWHNGEDAATLEVVRELSRHPRFHRLQLSRENKRLREPTNWFWSQAEAPFLSKVDDDCLLPKGWAEALLAAHESHPEIGINGCWRFYDEDFVPQLAARKIRDLGGGDRMLLNCWVQGSGYVMKRAVLERLGGLGPAESFTDYCVRAALAGWVNGWLYPFIHEEHMDDPRSPLSELRSEEDFLRHRPLSAVRDDVRTLAEWQRRIRYMARSVQAAPADPRQYVGWRRRLRRVTSRVGRLVGQAEGWRG